MKQLLLLFILFAGITFTQEACADVFDYDEVELSIDHEALSADVDLVNDLDVAPCDFVVYLKRYDIFTLDAEGKVLTNPELTAITQHRYNQRSKPLKSHFTSFYKRARDGLNWHRSMLC